jgi:diaminohydroxyphosphoribosylaminopyrimidine deaminase/5-amino-6-(5-phosphoribosylamino)uracil reductase
MSSPKERPSFSATDGAMMRVALAQAALGAGRTHPNPAVGAVLARDGEILGKGFHKGPGTPHAEVEAIREAGGGACGADLFVTLEPCCTWGRTPPCTLAVKEAGLRRVTAACLDPNPAVSGRGLDELHRAGVEAVVGLLGAEGVAADEAYHHFFTRGRPFVHLKWAQSMDGRARRPGGGYLTGPESRTRVHRDRFLSDAILVSAGTVLTDDPQLTVREGFGPKRLLRVVLDRRGRIRGGEGVFSTYNEGDIWVVRPESCAGSAFQKGPGTHLMTVPDGPGGGWNLGAVLRLLERGKVMGLYVEAVGRLSRQFLAERLVDRLSVHLAPLLVGAEGVPALGAGTLPTEGFPDMNGASWERLGRDWVVTLDIPGARTFIEETTCLRG